LGDALGELGINPLFLLAQVVNFLILFAAVRVLLWKPLMQWLDARREMQRKQEEDAEAIAQTRAGLDQERERILGEAREEASQVLSEARREAREAAEQAATEVQQQREQLLVQARQEAEEERTRVLGDMRDDIATLAIAAANRLVGETLDERRQRALVAAFFSGVREGRVDVLPEGVERIDGPIVVTSAVPLTEAEQASIRADLAARAGSAEVSFQVDPQIMGGLVVRAGDRVIDGSVAGQLEQLRQTLM
jgi:F-type H+-transporting ATPase subunit b